MKNYNKTLWGTIVAFFVGTSCCWLSSLALWLGGAAFIGGLSSLIEDVQVLIIGIGLLLLIVTIALYLKRTKKKIG